MCDGLTRGDAQFLQLCDSGSWVAPLLPVTGSQATSNPLIQFAEEAVVGHETEVAYPAPEILAKFLATATDRHATFAAGALAYAVLELLNILRADASLTAVALEDVADKFDSIGATDTAFLSIYHQLEFPR
mgnify:CR=1 FL=1